MTAREGGDQGQAASSRAISYLSAPMANSSQSALRRTASRWIRATFLPPAEFHFRRTNQPFGISHARFLARWVGRLFVLAAVVAGASLLFPAAPFADIPVAGIAVGLAALTGIALLFGAGDHAPAWFFRAILFYSIGLICLGVYGGGAPTSGAQFFYVWLSPFVFAFFPLRQATRLTTSLAIGYGIVLIVQVHQHPQMGSPGLILGMWLTTIASAVIVGMFVRHLSRSLRDVDLRMQRAFEDSPIGSAFLTRDFVMLEVNRSLSLT